MTRRMRGLWTVGIVLVAILVPPGHGQSIYPDIRVNGLNGPVTVEPVNVTTVTVALSGCGCDFVPADWWVLAETERGWLHYDLASDLWLPGIQPSYQGRMFGFPATPLFEYAGLAAGDYTCYFGLDTVVDGKISLNILFFDSVSFTVAAMPNVTAAEAVVLLEARARDPYFAVLDVRTDLEYRGGHIVNALNIDVNSGTFMTDVGMLDRDKAYLVYCRTGGRSLLASDTMRGMGFTEVYNMEGGFSTFEQLPAAQPFIVRP